MIIQPNENTAKLFEVFRLEGFEIRYVGGCVRDAILGLKSNDIDFACNANPDKMQEILSKNEIQYFDSGLKHGTITAVFDKTCYEITSLRHDLQCDGRHAVVEYTTQWRLDAERRDFTFNALYLDEEGNLYDYFNGVNDLQNGELNFIGDAKKRIQEDYLRILRAFRFHNRYCTKPIDEKTKLALMQNAHNIAELSGERIQQEIIKLFAEVKSINILNEMNFLGITQYVFLKSEIDFSTIFLLQDPWNRMAIIAKYNNLDILAIKNRWHISNKNYDFLKKIKSMIISGEFLTKPNKYFFLYSEYKEIFLSCCIVENIISDKDNIKWPELACPINNKILIDMGFQGKDIGEKLRLGINIWLENNCEISTEQIVCNF